MREILFRGKRVDDGEWLYGNYAFCDCFTQQQHYIYQKKALEHAVLQTTIGQYTGLTDKAGTKTFEHDCIRALHGDAIGVIRYGECNNAFDGYELPYHVGFFVDWVSGEDKDILRKDLGYWLKRVEVIGNIHDNPGLLNGGADND